MLEPLTHSTVQSLWINIGRKIIIKRIKTSNHLIMNTWFFFWELKLNMTFRICDTSSFFPYQPPCRMQFEYGIEGSPFWISALFLCACVINQVCCKIPNISITWFRNFPNQIPKSFHKEIKLLLRNTNNIFCDKFKLILMISCLLDR